MALNASQQARVDSQKLQLQGGAAGAAATAAAQAARAPANATPTSGFSFNNAKVGILTSTPTPPSGFSFDNAKTGFPNTDEKMKATLPQQNSSNVTRTPQGMTTPQAPTTTSTQPNSPTVQTQTTNPNAPLHPTVNQPTPVTQPKQASEITSETYVAATETPTTPEQTVTNNQAFYQEKLSTWEKDNKRKVFKDAAEFQKMITAHQNDPANWEAIFKRFSIPDTTPNLVASNANIQGTESTVSAANDVTPQEKVVSTISQQKKSNEEQLQDLLLNPDMSAADMLKASLLNELVTIDDPIVNDYLDNMANRAAAAYESGMAQSQVSMDEVDKIIDGYGIDPTTSYGLLAKIYKEEKDYDTQAYEENKSYLETKQKQTIDELRNNRADLEGYAKAKLYSIGAQDSSAGVTLVSKIIHEADVQIASADLEYTHTIAQLNIEGSKIMTDYTNNAAKLVMGIQGQQDTLLTDYNDKLDKIEESRLTSETEKRKAKSAAYTSYIKDSVSLQNDQKKQELDLFKQQVDSAEKLRDFAVKMSGVTGTIWTPNANGDLVDTGLATFEAKKWTDTASNTAMRTEIMANDQRISYAKNLLDMYGSAASDMVEQLLGYPEGSLAGFETIAEKKAAVEAMRSEILNQKDLDAMGNNTINGTLLQSYEDSGGGIKENGIGIDPMSLPDVRKNIMAQSSVTQQYSGPGGGGTDKGGAHGGTDVISKDGYVHAVRGGTVIATIPWDGANPYGNKVIVQDSTGLLWQYGHLGRKDGKGGVFGVKVGDVVEPGQSLGIMGNTGRVYSKKNPKDPTYGIHTDIRVVGRFTQPKVAQDFGPVGNAMHQTAKTIGGFVTGKEIKDKAYTPSQAEMEKMYFDKFGKMPSAGDKDAIKKFGMGAFETWEKLNPTDTLTAQPDLLAPVADY